MVSHKVVKPEKPKLRPRKSRVTAEKFELNRFESLKKLAEYSEESQSEMSSEMASSGTDPNIGSIPRLEKKEPVAIVPDSSTQLKSDLEGMSKDRINREALKELT